MLNIDYEKIGELKEKVKTFTNLASNINNKEGNEELLVFLCEKLNDIKKNETNIQVFINNIDRVDSFCYSDNKTEVFFK